MIQFLGLSMCNSFPRVFLVRVGHRGDSLEILEVKERQQSSCSILANVLTQFLA